MPTRFYMPSSGAAAVSPAFDGGWDTTPNDRLKMVTTKISSSMTDLTTDEELSVLGTKLGWRQYVSDPIPAQTVQGTVKGQIRVAEGDAAQNFDQVALVIKVVSNDGGTVRGTLLSIGGHVAANEFTVNTTKTNRKIADGDSLSSVAASANDRIVIEIGCIDSSFASLGADSLYASFGDDSGTDLPEDETTTAANNPWIEFSQTLFGVTGTPASVGIVASIPASTTAVVAVPASVEMLLSSSGGKTNVLSRPEAVELVVTSSEPGDETGLDADTYDPDAATSQNFVVMRPTTPSELGDADLSTFIQDETFTPAAGGTIAVTATVMADPVIPLATTISYVIFRACCWQFDRDVAHASNHRMEWTVGANTGSSALTNDGGLSEIFTQAADGIDSDETDVALRFFIRTGQIATQPNGSAWDVASLNAMQDVSVKFDYPIDTITAELEVSEIFVEVYGPQGSQVPPISVRALGGPFIIKTLKAPDSI